MAYLQKGILLLVLGLCAGHSGGWFQLSMFRVIDNQIYDYMMRSFPAKVSTDQIAILDIDEDSLAIPELGRWPW